MTLTRQTNGAGGNTGDAVKQFVDGSLAWFKNDDQGNRLGGATFQVCRTHNLDTSPSPDTFADVPDVCVTVLDNSASDADPDDGEFLLVDLILGHYTVREVPPFPPGFEPDPDTVTVEQGAAKSTAARLVVSLADRRHVDWRARRCSRAQRLRHPPTRYSSSLDCWADTGPGARAGACRHHPPRSSLHREAGRSRR